MATIIRTVMLISIGRTAMTDASAFYKILAWFSPGYPVGAYTYSHGLEQAVEAGFISDDKSAREWITAIISQGAGFTDAVFLAEAYRAATGGDMERLSSVAELAAAFSATKELALESHAQGAAFLEITRTAWHVPALDTLRDCWEGPYAYPVAVGCAAAGHGLAMEGTVHAYLHAFAANLISAAVRLVPLGQTQGQHIMAALEGSVAGAAEQALATDVEDAASTTLTVDICSMRHETQHTRLFRS